VPIAAHHSAAESEDRIFDDGRIGEEKRPLYILDRNVQATVSWNKGTLCIWRAGSLHEEAGIEPHEAKIGAQNLRISGLDAIVLMIF